MSSGWEYVELEGAVARGSSNISLNKVKDETGEYNLYGAKGLIKKISFYDQDKPYLAIIKDGAGVGRVSSHPGKSSVLATMQYLIPKDGYKIKFVEYFLNSISFNDFKTGSTIPHIYFKDYKNVKIPRISETEQGEIVTVLDSAFAKIDAALVNVRQNIINAEELFQSKLTQIFSNPDTSWQTKTLGEITSKIGSGATPKGGKDAYHSEGIPLIRSLNIHDLEFKKEKLAFLDSDQAKRLDNVILKENDILLNITGASVARCALLPKQYAGGRVNQHVSIIRLDSDTVNPEFAVNMLVSKYYKNLLLGIGKKGGSTRQAITKAQIQNFTISFPTVDDQQQLINDLNYLSDKTKLLRRKYQSEETSLLELKKSLLQKAFSGELTTKKV